MATQNAIGLWCRTKLYTLHSRQEPLPCLVFPWSHFLSCGTKHLSLVKKWIWVVLSFLCSLSFWGSLGVIELRRAWRGRPSMIWAGKSLVVACGAFLYCRRKLAIFCEAFPCAALYPSLNICTYLSACPLLEGWCGAMMIYFMPLRARKCVNSADVNRGPLSVTNLLGIPNRAKIPRNVCIVAVDVTECMGMTTKYLECASTTKRKCKLSIGPAKSMCIPYHGAKLSDRSICHPKCILTSTTFYLLSSDQGQIGLA